MLLGLRIGDPHDELLGAWLAKESVRDIYLTDDAAEAVTLVDKAIAGCADDEVEEIRSLAKTLSSWRNEIVAHHHSGASNGPTEGLNLLVKKVKRLSVTASGSSRTTASGCSFTPAVSLGPASLHRHVSELGLPTQTRRASFVRAVSQRSRFRASRHIASARLTHSAPPCLSRPRNAGISLCPLSCRLICTNPVASKRAVRSS